MYDNFVRNQTQDDELILFVYVGDYSETVS